jgi:hypothetical protein
VEAVQLRFGNETALSRCGKLWGKAFGGSPLLQQGGAGLQSSGEGAILKWALALGFSIPGAKARDQNRTLPGALKRSSHQEVHSMGYALTFSAACLAAAVTETLPQALKRDPRTDGSYARLKGVLHPSPIHQM